MKLIGRLSRLNTDPRRLGITALRIIALLLVISGMGIWGTRHPTTVFVDMATDTGTVGQLFLATKSGYSERTAVPFELWTGEKRHQYRIDFTAPRMPSTIRLDPGNTPGPVKIYGMRFVSGTAEIRLDTESLRTQLRLRNHLSMENGTGNAIILTSSGNDPFLEVAIPAELKRLSRKSRALGASMIAAGLLTIVIPALVHPRRSVIAVRRAFAQGGISLFLLVAATTALLLGALQSGFAEYLPSLRGMRYGAALLAGALEFAAVGAACMKLLGLPVLRGNCSRLFLWIAIGQVALLLYVYLRSALHAAVPYLPLTAPELLAVVAAALVFLFRKPAPIAQLARQGKQSRWWLMQLSMLTTICIVVADRELPRIVMLSSDPDIHAYLAQQLESIGGIPWKGEAVFGYPAGSPALVFSWAELSFLDVRNALSALPLLLSFLTALVIAEAMAVRSHRLPVRLLLLLTALGVTAAGLLVPLFSNYSHMEGAGRQMGILFMAIFPAALLGSPRMLSFQSTRWAPLILASLFALAALNPVNVVIPFIVVCAYILYAMLNGRRQSLGLALAMLALPLLLLLDPYYFDLFFGSKGSSPKIIITDSFGVLGTHQIFSGWKSGLLQAPGHVFSNLAKLMPAHKLPLFGVFLSVTAIAIVTLSKRRRVGFPAMAAVMVPLAVIVCLQALFGAVSRDSRFYLLSPYFSLNLSQHKMLLLTIVSCVIVWLASLRKMHGGALFALAMALIFSIRLGTHAAQDYRSEPRYDYCGSLGCATDSDLKAMEQMEKLTAAGTGALSSTTGRVLVPNSVHDTRNEFWIFPSSGARALPFYGIPSVAFYYFQGDDDYTTQNYMDHVCKKLDRQWLKEQGINYIFLPSVRADACVAGMEQLPITEDVILKQGNTYLIKLH